MGTPSPRNDALPYCGAGSRTAWPHLPSRRQWVSRHDAGHRVTELLPPLGLPFPEYNYYTGQILIEQVS